jgi:hypothetical protein
VVPLDVLLEDGTDVAGCDTLDGVLEVGMPLDGTPLDGVLEVGTPLDGVLEVGMPLDGVLEVGVGFTPEMSVSILEVTLAGGLGIEAFAGIKAIVTSMPLVRTSEAGLPETGVPV